MWYIFWNMILEEIRCKYHITWIKKCTHIILAQFSAKEKSNSAARENIVIRWDPDKKKVIQTFYESHFV